MDRRVQMVPELVTGGVVATAFGWLFILYQKKSAEHDKTLGLYATIIDRAMQAERDKSAIATEHNFLQQSIVQLMQRKVEVTLTDQQLNQVVLLVAQLVNAAIKPKEQAD
jgi:hypothetical protein